MPEHALEPSSTSLPPSLPLPEQSEEIQDIITAVPAWIVRWGITLYFFLLAAVVAGTWLIHYPDLVEVPLQLTSVNAPKAVNAKTDGKLVKLLIAEGAQVQAGQELAFIESTADHAQVLDFAQRLEQLHDLLVGGQEARLPAAGLGEYTKLGEIQAAYQTFEQAYTQYLAYQRNGYFPQKRRILVREIADLQALNRNLTDQKQLYERDFALARSEYATQQELSRQRVIAPADFRKEESRLLTKQLPVKQAESTIYQNYMLQTAKQKELLELDKISGEQRGLLVQALNTLRSTVANWKTRYVLVAPTGGRVYFSAILEEKQTLAANQEVFYVAPTTAAYYGEAVLPLSSVGKVKVGQEVILKFAGYPFEEFGAVPGRLTYISQIPKDNGFLAKVSLPQGLVTTYGKPIGYRKGISASAAIVTEDARLIEKIFYNFKRALSR
ncbi:HlyD family efflux transporter periplasmic adaptor subunit [Hymenobacter aquaticus]|uniref:HlyD family efflux transporter periplasmic adaptor subunit n=1 Tax=Hymenobacter aquaticus TaxID=1867101 RepID=A0A4Z0Q611_9BACT|nr:HlyD family efflux transporter periplasmic adaptor subunit [Hymenobacter aquaticus]TGE25517.1 HlyD family efflux transporter periplasmic adaptor subunit [Hymenobacter aquaticus]